MFKTITQEKVNVQYNNWYTVYTWMCAHSTRDVENRLCLQSQVFIHDYPCNVICQTLIVCFNSLGDGGGVAKLCRNIWPKDS